MIHTEDSRTVLEEFLSCPLHNTDAVFARFEALPGAVFQTGGNPLERYVCIPGKKDNKIVLVAHADTVWDDVYGNSAETTVQFRDGIFVGNNPACGIGGDDRAGCAMLWALRDCGHTLLLVSGEEKGKLGAKFLRKANPQLFRILNRHAFMIELDWRGTGVCLYNQVDYTKRFHTYITKTLGFQEESNKGGTDLQFLCHRICGVNIGVGYHGWHRPGEYVVLAEWENTLRCLSTFLEINHPKFPVSIPKRMCKPFVRAKNKVMRIIKKTRS